MRDIWIRIRKINNPDTHHKDMFEARVDLFPDAAVYADTADEAYVQMRSLVPDMTESYIETHGHVPWKEHSPDSCEHGRGLTDYCEPCGRVNGGP